MSTLSQLLAMIALHDGNTDKATLLALIVQKFGLKKDGAIYYCDEFAIHFGKSSTQKPLSSLMRFILDNGNPTVYQSPRQIRFGLRVDY